jgi:hypothetical protein
VEKHMWSGWGWVGVGNKIKKISPTHKNKKIKKK